MKNLSISQTEIKEKWYVVNVEGMRLGIAASKIAEILLGKNDPLVREYLDPKVNVIVLNALKLDIPAKRAVTKFYKRYSGFTGGLKFTSLEEQLVKDATFPIENAVRGMLPKNSRGRKIITRLRIFEGEEHKHEAAKPEFIDIKNFKA